MNKGKNKPKVKKNLIAKFTAAENKILFKNTCVPNFWLKIVIKKHGLLFYDNYHKIINVENFSILLLYFVPAFKKKIKTTKMNF